ncbi:sirohydrochlorin chelatase [Corynebacterium renale]|uniref:Sirohydrochlorin ferrochelatase n=1 Tax=Corynebacterium renale TaxID=1724 RepID=A0A2A9DMA4_9CORY|nr:CbiX/SirB N-terminal domain-containing protein [Corynebacterium renale]PFG27877.1 sirohydrochlorin ferrochelatase [Corynebacterium renale]SQI21974.1 sirohydrochlorin ferrochelatase [Corynebacterium renale]
MTIALITLAHGSRHPGASTHAVARAAGQAAGLDADAVGAANLELARPSLSEVAADLVAAGHHRAVVVPLLFTEAYHSTWDVPAAVARAQDETGISLRIAGGLGTGPDISAVLEKQAPAGKRTVLYAVGSSHEPANAAVTGLARSLGWEVAFATRSPRLEGPAHVVPLFVTDGLLLDKARHVPGTHVAPPLGEALAQVVADRYFTEVGAWLRSSSLVLPA